VTGASTQTTITVDTVLSRASMYVGRYVDAMVSLVAKERYVQDVSPMRPRLPSFNGGVQQVPSGTQHRELTAEVAMIRTGPTEWRVYRDVFEVNGRTIPDRKTRLERLILQPNEALKAQAERIAEESARYNLTTHVRWLNEPGLPLVFLDAVDRGRSDFSVVTKGSKEWVISFVERARPALFTHEGVGELPSTGRFWINPDDGEVTQTELVASPSGAHATFTTRFRHDQQFGIAVPDEMRELVTEGIANDAKRLESVAKYSDYRSFSVSMKERIR